MTENLTTSVSADAIATAAERLRTAAATGEPTPPVRDLIGADDIAAAYAVQNINIAAAIESGRVVVGRKIGLTSEAVQKQLGVDIPDFGWLTDDMAFVDGDAIPYNSVLQAKAEAEVAFVLKADLAEGDLDYDQVKDAIDYGVAAIEVCGSRVADWDIKFGDTVADNASAGVYVLGTERKTLDEFNPVDVEMKMSIGGEVVSEGNGAACLGDPINAVQWLAKYARDFGNPLRAGQVLLSGALGPMRPITPGAEVSVEITGLGSVSATFPA